MLCKDYQGTHDLGQVTPENSISGTILGNDQILCGSVASTNYIITPMKDSTLPSVMELPK